MIFYRYEADDGGGPYFTRDGRNRITGEQYSDDTLDGTTNLKDLIAYFKDKQEVIKDCSIKIYEGELIHKNLNGTCIFKKSTAKKIFDYN